MQIFLQLNPLFVGTVSFKKEKAPGIFQLLQSFVCLLLSDVKWFCFIFWVWFLSFISQKSVSKSVSKQKKKWFFDFSPFPAKKKKKSEKNIGQKNRSREK